MADVVLEMEVLVVVGRSNVLFSKGMMDTGPDLFRYGSVKELASYIKNKDADVETVKVLIRRANRELKILRSKKLYIRKSSRKDKDAENPICITSR